MHTTSHTTSPAYDQEVAADTFGDADVEDGYDASDPIDVRLLIIAKAIIDSRSDPVYGFARRTEIARLLRNIVAEVLLEDG